MITVTQNVGRLAEIRMTAPVSAEDLAAMQRDISGILGRAQGRIVVCADLSGAALFTDDLSDRIAKFFRQANSKLERTAIVVCNAATLFLQIERLLREGPAAPPASRPDSSRNGTNGSSREATSSRRNGAEPTNGRRTTDPQTGVRLGSDPAMAKRAAAVARMSERRAFRVTGEAMTWLDEVLTSEERARLRMFLEGPRVATPAR